MLNDIKVKNKKSQSEVGLILLLRIFFGIKQHIQKITRYLISFCMFQILKSCSVYIRTL